MTIAQIIMISVMSLSYFYSAFYRLFKYDNEKHNTGVEIIIFSMTMLLLILTVIQVNDFKKELKCPEYEKLENVYRLKQ